MGARSIQLLYLMAYQLYHPRYFVYIYLLAIHISGMTCYPEKVYCVKLLEIHI